MTERMPTSETLTIRRFTPADIGRAKNFADRAIGTDYYTEKELIEILKRSEMNGEVCSLVLEDALGAIRGIRITYPPGHWSHGKGKGLTPAKWKVPLAESAYFQSLFVDPSLTGQGWGKRLSFEALRILRELGAKAVVTHSWKESPNDSSGRYLRALGFEVVATHPLYWNEIDYVCTRCGKPCVCTADEMIKYL
jgi:predicted N-acetyltransferase YhbS